MEIQRQQRRSAYGFAELLNRFRQYVITLAKLLGGSIGADRKDNSEFSFPQNQHAIFNCLLLQKVFQLSNLNDVHGTSVVTTLD